DFHVTGVQTCALPISSKRGSVRPSSSCSSSSGRTPPIRPPPICISSWTPAMRLERISFAKRLEAYGEAIKLPDQPILEGRLLRMVGLTLEAEGLQAAVGSRCLVINNDRYHPSQVEAEVMGFSGGKLFLMPVGSLAGIAPGARVVPLADTGRLPMGTSMLGRVIDGAGRALDGKGGMKAEDWVPMDG